MDEDLVRRIAAHPQYQELKRRRIGIWLFSVLDTSARAAVDKGGFEARQVRSETGIGAHAASGH